MHRLTALEVRDKVRSGELSAEAVTQHFLKRIEQLDPEIGAFICVLKERALEKARAVDQKRASGESLGKLAGIPVAIKDNMHIQGEITTCASKFLTNYKAPFWSTAVALMEEEDAIILGKTNLDEFAMGSGTEYSALQETGNPWNLDCSPGGSSGGSAAAVAARLCLLATGSDTGGSIRQPAAFCGVSGFKPSYGRVSRYGLVAFASSLDQIGLFATNPTDIALGMEVIGQHDPCDSTSLDIPQENYLEGVGGDINGWTIGVPWNFLKQLKGDAKTNFEQSVEKLKELGCKIVDVDLDILEHGVGIYYVVAPAEASTNLARFDGVRYGQRSPDADTLNKVYDLSREEGFGYEVKKRIMLGTFVLSSGYQDAYYKQAQRARTVVIDAYRKAFEGCDLIAMPVTPSTAFKRKSHKDPFDMYLEDLYTIGCNLAGLPGMSIPAGFGADGMPLGLQLIGPQKGDQQVFQAAAAVDQALGCSTKMPNSFAEETSVS